MAALAFSFLIAQTPNDGNENDSPAGRAAEMPLGSNNNTIIYW